MAVMRILHVEDNPLDADLTRLALARTLPQSTVVTAPSLAAAAAALDREGPFDVLLVDLQLSDGSGLELVVGVRTRGAPIAVIVLTGSGDERSAVAALKAGADDYLVKGGDYLVQLPALIESAVAYTEAQQGRRKAIRVLYAEHDAMDVDMTRRHLARHAPHIVLESVPTGEAVPTRMQKGPPIDVLLLDFRLAGANALELMTSLGGAGGAPSLPVVLVTGHGAEAVAVQALRFGAVDYIVKRTGYLFELAAVLENAHHRAELERKQAALRSSESAHRLAERALAAISQGVFLTDAGQRIVYANDALHRLTGCAPGTILGREPTFLHGDRTDPAQRDQFGSALAAGRPFAAVVVSHRQDGTAFWNQVSLTPVRDAAGALTHTVGVVQDVSEQRRLEEQFRQAQKMEAIGQLSGGIAHDFNNLLMVIQGHLGCLQGASPLASSQRESLDAITRAADRAAELTKQLLAFGRKQVMQVQPVELTDLVARTLAMLRRVIDRRIEIEVHSASTATWLRADPGMLDHVLVNLCLNARDAMPDGGRLSIQVAPATPQDLLACGLPAGASAAGGWCCLAVSDTGVGIPEAIRGRIWEPFFTTKEVGKGTGLGLASVYGIVRQHGGGCGVDSEPGRGTRMILCLPTAAPPVADAASAHTAPAPAVAAAAPAPALPPAPAGRETILLVEDDEGVGALMHAMLTGAGYQVLTATSGRRALDAWRTHGARIDLLITDQAMPDGMSGQDLARRLHAERPELPVVFTSGYSVEVAGLDAARALPAGCRFLGKPFTRDLLLAAVRDVLSARATPPG
jgi:PAS domain S-box-containing protein